MSLVVGQDVASRSAATTTTTATATITEENNHLYAQLLTLRDAVIAGTHTQIKLPPDVVEQLKATLAPSTRNGSGPNGIVSEQSAAPADVQQSMPRPPLQHAVSPLQPQSASNGWTNGAYSSQPPNLNTMPSADRTKHAEALVRARVQRIKRQHIEKELAKQVNGIKKLGPDTDHSSPIDVDNVLHKAHEQVPPQSGVRATGERVVGSSFDENDYYSSQVQSEWPSTPASNKDATNVATAPTGQVDRRGGHASAFVSARKPLVASNTFPAPDAAVLVGAGGAEAGPRAGPRVQPPAEPQAEDEDDEYTPPATIEFEGTRNPGTEPNGQLLSKPDSDSEYEPDEIQANVQPEAPSPYNPVIRNRLTNIIASQSNRVSPLAMAGIPNGELQLVNSRPVVAENHQQRQDLPSRGFSTSPTDAVPRSNNTKRKVKKRKRDAEPQTLSRRRRAKAAAFRAPESPLLDEPFIKTEPVSPPPMEGLPSPSLYTQHHDARRPVPVDLVSSHNEQVFQSRRHVDMAVPYFSREPTMHQVLHVDSTAQRPYARDAFDARRDGGFQLAPPPVSTPRQAVAPGEPYRMTPVVYDEPHVVRPFDAGAVSFERVSYPPASQNRPMSPPRFDVHREPLRAQVATPHLMPPPPRRIIIDQNGQRYYATEQAPSPAMEPAVGLRYSVAPEPLYDRQPSRLSYAQPERMPASDYVDGRGYAVPARASRAAEYARYPDELAAHASPPCGVPELQPPQPLPYHQRDRVPSSQYARVQHHSARPGEPAPAAKVFLQHASVAPVQYAQPQTLQPYAHAPSRAPSVVPSYDYPGGPSNNNAPAPTYGGPPPHAMWYVDNKRHVRGGYGY